MSLQEGQRGALVATLTLSTIWRGTPDPQGPHLLLHILFLLQERLPVQEAGAECPGVSASAPATWPPLLEHKSGRKGVGR